VALQHVQYLDVQGQAAKGRLILKDQSQCRCRGILHTSLCLLLCGKIEFGASSGHNGRYRKHDCLDHWDVVPLSLAPWQDYLDLSLSFRYVVQVLVGKRTDLAFRLFFLVFIATTMCRRPGLGCYIFGMMVSRPSVSGHLVRSCQHLA